MDIIKPNTDELKELVRACLAQGGPAALTAPAVGDIMSAAAGEKPSKGDIALLARTLCGFMAKGGRVIVSMGADGMLWCSAEGSYSSKAALQIVNPDGRSLVTNGAGDAFSGGFVAGLCVAGEGSSSDEISVAVFEAAVERGLESARRRILLDCGL